MKANTISSTNSVANTIFGTTHVNTLLAQAKGNDPRIAEKAKTLLYDAYIGMIKAAVVKTHCPASQFDDCLSNAQLGFLKAIDDYDFSIGTPFHAFASMHIEFALLEGFEQDSPVHVAHSIYSDLSKVKKARRKLEQEYLGEVSISDIAKATKLSKTQVKRALDAERSYNTKEIDTPAKQYGDTDDCDMPTLMYDTADEVNTEATDKDDFEIIKALTVRASQVLCSKDKAETLAETLKLLKEGYRLKDIPGILGLTKTCFEKRTGVVKRTLRENEQFMAYYHSLAA